jgi:two-component system response regulator AtoC
MAKILIVDDKPSMRKMLKEALEVQGHECRVASSGAEALLLLRKDACDLCLTDLRMPEISGLELLREAKESASDTAVILMTAYGSVETAVEAMRLGAADFLPKPFSLEHLKVVVDKALQVKALRAENLGLKTQLADSYKFEGVEGISKAMKKLHALVRRVAPSDSAVLIQGESGTGKELIAQAIHMNSSRRDKPFLKVNCAALAQGVLESELFGHEKGAFTGAHQRRLGRFELASGGTIFLDEVGDLGMDSQVKLLRVLQEREFERVGGTTPIRTDVRVVAASNRDLKALVGENRFREDLFFRLNVVPLVLPPLRERREDIPTLARFFIQKHQAPGKFSAGVKLSGEAEAVLLKYPFPGNVRELENIMQRAIVLLDADGVVRVEQIPREIVAGKSKKPGLNFNRQVVDLERRLILDALEKAQGSQTAAAKALGMNRTLLIYKLKKHKIRPESFKKAPAKKK